MTTERATTELRVKIYRGDVPHDECGECGYSEETNSSFFCQLFEKDWQKEKYTDEEDPDLYWRRLYQDTDEENALRCQACLDAEIEEKS
jgi:hypothetical protein